MLRRAPVADEVTRDGETVVMLGGQVILLSPLASAVWQWMSESAAVAASQLVDLLVDRFGVPDGVDPEIATEAVVDDLVAVGLLIREG